MSESLHTIADYIRYVFSSMNREDIYFGHGTDNSWDESVQLVLQSLHLPWDFDRSLWNSRLTDFEKETLDKNIESRIKDRVPLAYLTNQAWFCGLPFYVDDRVLVPRSPIAELIENQFHPWLLEPPRKIMDLCTGSGCIGIALSTMFEGSHVDLVDISSEALEVADINIEKHQLERSVSTIQSDLFSQVPAFQDYDLIVSNPPYVDAVDYSEMPDEYSKEPKLGLVAGDDGLDIVRRILRDAGQYLSSNGLLVVELGNSWVALDEAYPDYPFTWIEFENGGHGVFVMSAEELNSRAW